MSEQNYTYLLTFSTVRDRRKIRSRVTLVCGIQTKMVALTSRNSPIKCLLWLDEPTVKKFSKSLIQIVSLIQSDLLWVFHYDVGHGVSHKHTIFSLVDDELMSEKELKESSIISC
jgi:hypothetical protein